ncbi:hypothetical protein D046_3019C, partial [Vibrio parahaemolyticus V-223/04]
LSIAIVNNLITFKFSSLNFTSHTRLENDLQNHIII